MVVIGVDPCRCREIGSGKGGVPDYRITRDSLLSISATPSAGVLVRARMALAVVRMASLTSP
jgi:hypothetical protein